MLPSSHPSGISHSIVSSTRWRKFLWVSLYGYGSSAGRKRDSITVCCRFLLYDDDNSLSFLVKDKQKLFFFAKMMKMMKAILAAVWHLLDKYSFATPDLYFLLPKFSSLLMRVGGVARASHGKTTTLMNMSANVGEFLPKTTSRNPYKKPDQTTVGNDNMQSSIHAINCIRPNLGVAWTQS